MSGKQRAIVAGGGALLVLAVAVLSLHGWYQRRAGAWEQERQQLLAANDAVTRDRQEALGVAAAMLEERDAARDSAAAAGQRAAVAERRASRLAAARSSLPPLPVDATIADSLHRYQELLTLADQQIDALSMALTETKEKAAELQRAGIALDSAVARLTQQVASEAANAARLAQQLADSQAPCRFLFFPCPSRTVVAVSGTLLGLVVGIGVGR